MADPFEQDFLKNFQASSEILQKKTGIVYTGWNREIISKMLDGAKEVLIKAGLTNDHLIEKQVPGSFELPLGAARLLQSKDIAGVICLGCVIRGETPHFDFISSAVAHQLAALNVQFMRPVIFGVLTTGTYQQALDRAGGKKGNKGSEAAATYLQMTE
jgi:6,7-dimethyl-8-ribityllumazine synthase